MLGIIHNLWRPVPGRIKDFIAMPRPNFYQSLHTSVITEDGTPFEIQIRTEEMHKMAEEGIAAHWKYKDGPVSAQDEQRLAWLRQVVEWQRDVSDPNEFLSTLKVDFYPEEVYTFTPKGQSGGAAAGCHPDRFCLFRSHRSWAHLHRRQGERSHGATALQAALAGTSSRSSRSRGISPAAIGSALVKSSRSRNKIKHWLNVHQRERAIEIGRKLIEKEARKYRIALKEHQGRRLARVASGYGLGKADDLMSGIGYGKYSARQVLARLLPPGRRIRLPAISNPKDDVAARRLDQRRTTRFRRRPQSPSRCSGQGDMLVYRARCCNPIRGEAIVGYITRGKGVAVHSVNCPNVTEPAVRTGAQDRRRVGARRQHPHALIP